MDNIDPTANGGVKEGRLAGFLQSQKELFLQDLRDGKGKGWTVATGNEAGGGWMTEVSK
jgi:exopolyphosphatase